MSPDWDDHCDKVLDLIKKKAPVETLKSAMKEVKDVNAWHNWRDATFSLLFHSVIENHFEAFKLLLTLGSDPSLVNDRGTNILHLLMKRGLVDWADICVANMEDSKKVKFVNNGQRNGWTPLMSAAENNQINSCKWLLSNGAKVNFCMDSGWTASHAASKMGNKEILQLFLDSGGDKNLEASHRDFGRNLKVEDVTVEDEIVELLRKF